MARKARLVGPVTIVDFAHKGKLIGKDEEGNVYLVNEVVPGDVVSFLYKRNKKGLRTGKVVEIIKKSEHRTKAVCAHFGSCGGCNYQNIAYDAQLHFKEKMVRDAVRKIAKDQVSINPIIGSAKQLDYRNKMMFSFSTDRWLTRDEIESGDENINYPVVGFRTNGSFYRIVNVDQCHLQDGLTNDIRNYIRDYAHEHELSFYDIRNNVGLLRNLIIRRTTLDEYMVVVCYGAHQPINMGKLHTALIAKFSEITSLFYVVNIKLNDSLYDQKMIHAAGAKVIVEQLGTMKFKIGPMSFFQTNSTQAVVLYDEIKKHAQLKSSDRVYDLYCGLGSISLYVAADCAHVVGIEEVSMAIEDANRNKTLNGVENVDFHCGDVKRVMDDIFVKKYGAPDVVITDPPRAGMHPEVVHSLIKLAAPKIVYVSCNPATMARDLYLLKEKYEIISVTPVDMFPQTAHVESVTTLKLKEI